MDPRAASAPRKITPLPSSFRRITGDKDNAEDKKFIADLGKLKLGADVATITEARDMIYILRQSVPVNDEKKQADAKRVVKMMFKKKDGGVSAASNLLTQVAAEETSQLLANPPNLGLELKSILRDVLTQSQELLDAVLSVVQKANKSRDAKEVLRGQGVNVDDVRKAIQASLLKCQQEQKTKRSVGTSPRPTQNKKPKSRGFSLKSIVTKQAPAPVVSEKTEKSKPPRQKISQNVAVARSPPEAVAAPAPSAMASDDDSNPFDNSWESRKKELEEIAEFRRIKPWMLLVLDLVDPMDMNPNFFEVSTRLGLDEYLQALKEGRENPEEAIPARYQQDYSDDEAN